MYISNAAQPRSCVQGDCLKHCGRAWFYQEDYTCLISNWVLSNWARF